MLDPSKAVFNFLSGLHFNNQSLVSLNHPKKVVEIGNHKFSQSLYTFFGAGKIFLKLSINIHNLHEYKYCNDIEYSIYRETTKLATPEKCGSVKTNLSLQGYVCKCMLLYFNICIPSRERIHIPPG